MIKFKEFNVGDADYKEQMEQFQTENQNAEFVQITGGHMSYEKIWFKYESSDTSVSTDKLSVEKLQEQLNTAKYFFKNILDVNPNLNKGHVSHLENSVRVMKNSAEKALAAIGGDDDENRL